MRICALATFIVRKSTSNFVTESEMVNSVSVKQSYPLIALPICIDMIHGYTGLCVYKLGFSGELTWFILIIFLKKKASPYQETCQLQHGVSKTMVLIIDFSKFELPT